MFQIKKHQKLWTNTYDITSILDIDDETIEKIMFLKVSNELKIC